MWADRDLTGAHVPATSSLAFRAEFPKHSLQYTYIVPFYTNLVPTEQFDLHNITCTVVPNAYRTERERKNSNVTIQVGRDPSHWSRTSPVGCLTVKIPSFTSATHAHIPS